MEFDTKNTLTSALDGLQVGMTRARNAASDINKLTTGSNDVRDAVKPLLDLHKAETEVALNAKVIKAQDESLGRFVDEMA
jgi:hypothetical protein